MIWIWRLDKCLEHADSMTRRHSAFGARCRMVNGNHEDVSRGRIFWRRGCLEQGVPLLGAAARQDVSIPQAAPPSESKSRGPASPTIGSMRRRVSCSFAFANGQSLTRASSSGYEDSSAGRIAHCSFSAAAGNDDDECTIPVKRERAKPPPSPARAPLPSGRPSH